ncbi:MAG TPA: shikimate kinase [Blastocatellia bacterium]|nr:shikimate kinase [Blastocatellia bacterium]
MKDEKTKKALLAGIGLNVRALRQDHNLTVRDFAARARLSQRFINQLEAGEANISIAKLAQVAQALGRSLPDLIAPAEQDNSLRARTWRLLSQCNDEDWRALHDWLEKRKGERATGQFIALIGLRGVGKSTVGPLLARRFRTEFIELDHWVEEAAGMSLAGIFNTHGERYYQRLEREALMRLFAASQGCVFAPGGSIVNDAESWEQIKQRCFTVWLHATPQELMKRMLKAGETRLTHSPTVMTDMKALMARREPLYSESNLIIKTSGKTPATVASLITKAIASNGKH